MSDPLPRNAATIDLSSQQNLRASVTYLNEDEDALPAGARVVEPALDSTQAVRGSLFAIVEFSPESAGTPTLGEYDALSDKLLSTLQRSYYTLRGSQSAVLAEAMRNAQNVVQEYNAAHPKGTVRVSVACATLLKRRLMIACTGAAFMILRNGERVELYPTSPGSLRPAAPDDPRSYEVLRWDLSPGDVVMLAGAGWSDRIALRTLAATVYYLEEGMAGEAAKGLQEQSGGVNAPGILLEIAGEPEAAARAANPLLANLGPRPAQSGPTLTSAAAVAVATLPSAPLPAAAVRPTAPTPAATIAPLDLSQANPLYAAKKSTALPTAMAATPPVDLTPDPSPEERGEDISPLSRGEDYSPLSSGEGSGVRSTDAPDHQITETPIAFPSPTITVVPDISEKTRPIPVANVVAAAAASNPDTNTPPTGMEKARTFFRNMLPEKRADVPEGFALIDSDENARPYSEAAQQSWSPAATVPVADAPNFQESAPPVFTPPAPATGSRARLIISIALIIALLIPIGVGAFAWRLQGGIRAEAQQLIEMAAARTLGASDALDREDKRAALNMLSEGEDLLDRAEELVGPSAPMADLRDEMRRLEMDAAQVDPLYQLTTPLVTFPSGSAASRVLVGDQEIYVLDPGRGVVDRYRMDSTLESVPDQSGIPVIRTGDTIAGTTVGPLLDMAWLPIVPGYDDRATLVVLDANNHFFRYDPRVEGAMLLTPGAASTLESVRQMEVFQGRLYLADVGLQQVLRYGAGQYGGTPDPWFGQATNLDEMESMQIDGDIWMLVKNGQVLRFNQGRQLPYSLDGSVGLVRQAVDFFVGDGTNPFIFVVDKAGERIWVYNKETGEYVKQFAAPEGNPLAGLSSLYIEGVKSMYLLTNSALYKHPFPQDAPVNP